MEYRTNGGQRYFFPEIDDRLKDIFAFILKNKFTMSNPSDLIATINAARYVATHNIDGDFVECGVWRGGNALAAKMVFERYECDKNVYLFDTFAGMVKPSEEDTSYANHRPNPLKTYLEAQKDDHNEWCYASLDDVKTNFRTAGVDIEKCVFVQGDVRQTLTESKNLPDRISVLRLDTDWYESSKVEINCLYPLLEIGGVLLLDDYALWDGHRKAVDEYFLSLEPFKRPFLTAIGEKGRSAVKVFQV